LAELIDRIGKKSVVVQKAVNGFIGNRIQFAVLREALKMDNKSLGVYQYALTLGIYLC
jgi:3-hydroxybutyryl-CoA dehydrogenase